MTDGRPRRCYVEGRLVAGAGEQRNGCILISVVGLVVVVVVLVVVVELSQLSRLLAGQVFEEGTWKQRHWENQHILRWRRNAG